MFEIITENSSVTIAGALKAIGSTKQNELATRLGLKDAAQLSRAKKSGKLSPKLVDRFKTLQGELGDAPEPVPTKKEDPLGDTINIELLQTDESIQQRVEHIDAETVARYVEDAREVWPFPPIVVFRDSDGKHWLADGFHRVTAAGRVGRDEIPADIRIGERNEAFLYAAGANATHGLPRTNADKWKAVTTLLDHPMTVTWSDRQIANHCKVAHSFVGKVREEFEAEGLASLDSESSQIVDSSATTVMSFDLGGDGKVQNAKLHRPATRKTKDGRTINTAGIGAANKARAKNPTPPKSPVKQAQESILKFSGICADMRKLEEHLTESEITNVAKVCRDQLIWCMKRIPIKEVAPILEKIANAVEVA